MQQCADRKFREIGREHAGIELGNIQQRLEQLVHCRDRGIDAFDDSARDRRATRLRSCANEKAQRVQRLAQIMAGRGEKAGLGEIGEFELLRALLDFALQGGV